MSLALPAAACLACCCAGRCRPPPLAGPAAAARRRSRGRLPTTRAQWPCLPPPGLWEQRGTACAKAGRPCREGLHALRGRRDSSSTTFRPLPSGCWAASPGPCARRRRARCASARARRGPRGGAAAAARAARAAAGAAVGWPGARASTGSPLSPWRAQGARVRSTPVWSRWRSTCCSSAPSSSGTTCCAQVGALLCTRRPGGRPPRLQRPAARAGALRPRPPHWALRGSRASRRRAGIPRGLGGRHPRRHGAAAAGAHRGARGPAVPGGGPRLCRPLAGRGAAGLRMQRRQAALRRGHERGAHRRKRAGAGRGGGGCAACAACACAGPAWPRQEQAPPGGRAGVGVCACEASAQRQPAPLPPHLRGVP